MLIIEILKNGEVVASHSSVNLWKIVFDNVGFTIYTPGHHTIYSYEEYTFRVQGQHD